MASKGQQYELLEQSVDHQHDQDHDRTHSEQDQSDLLQPVEHVLSHKSSPNYALLEATRPSKASIFWIVISHIIVTGILIATIVLGATQRTYAINEQAQFLGLTLSVDNQMFFYGIFNKIADYVLDDSIGQISGVLLTVWMSGTTRFPGVLPLDFELSEEMSKPWRAILNAVHRWKLDPPRNMPASIFRILATFASSWTVLLLGGSFNVVAMPKLRWAGRYAGGGSPDTSIGIHVEVPTTRIDNINWSNLDNSYNEIFANGTNGSSPSPLGGALAAVSLLDMLTDLVFAIDTGSQFVSNINQRSPGFVNLHTIQRARPVQYGVNFREPALAVRGRGFTNANLSTEITLSTLSIQEGPVYDFWTDTNHSSYAAKGLGIRNWFNFTLPMLSTTCATTTTNTSAQDTSIIAPEQSSSTFMINIPSNDTSSGVHCTLSVRQSVFPIYVYNSTQDARDELNTPLTMTEADMNYLQFDAQNTAIASSLAARLNTTIPHLEQATGTSFATTLTSFATYLSKNANSTYITSSDMAMNYIVGGLAQHLITIAVWEESDSDQRHLVGPIQYQLYGSGPRQDWQWAIAMVLGLAIIVLAYDMFLLAYKRSKPGPWLDVPGMMIAANSASSLRKGDDGDDGAWKIGDFPEEVERTKYCLAPGSDGLVEISRLDLWKRKGYPAQQ